MAGKLPGAGQPEALQRHRAFRTYNLNGPNPLPFSFKIPKDLESSTFAFFAILCAKDEADADCAARIFPFPNELDATIPSRDYYRLIPKGFRLTRCGTKNAMYLHHFKSPAGSATAESYKNSGATPELTEGISF